MSLWWPGSVLVGHRGLGTGVAGADERLPDGVHRRVVGLVGNKGQSNYAASKAGLIGLTKSVAKEFASRNILANAIAPGFISTDMTDAMTAEARAVLTGQIPLERLGSPKDVASMVAFLASEHASYITGQVLVIDGGMVM